MSKKTKLGSQKAKFECFVIDVKEPLEQPARKKWSPQAAENFTPNDKKNEKSYFKNLLTLSVFSFVWMQQMKENGFSNCEQYNQCVSNCWGFAEGQCKAFCKKDFPC